jgi:hypothetical protein
MIIVSSFKINHNKSTGFFTITTEEIINCPLCSSDLSYRDCIQRKTKNVLGETRNFLLRRLRCQNPKCKKLHTELPSIIQPYKHYDSNTIQSVLDGNVGASECAADNSTIRRWKSEFASAKVDICQRLASIYAKTTDEKPPIRDTIYILDLIKAQIKIWLAIVMKLLINDGHKLCTQFAFCPLATSAKVHGRNMNVAEGSKVHDKTFKDTS